MVHFELDGIQQPTGTGILVREEPFDTWNAGGVLTINAAAQLLTAGPVSGNHYIKVRNESTGGQTIAFDETNAVTIAASPVLLNPGEEWIVQPVRISLYCIASAAGGTLRWLMLGTI